MQYNFTFRKIQNKTICSTNDGFSFDLETGNIFHFYLDEENAEVTNIDWAYFLCGNLEGANIQHIFGETKLIAAEIVQRDVKTETSLETEIGLGLTFETETNEGIIVDKHFVPFNFHLSNLFQKF